MRSPLEDLFVIPHQVTPIIDLIYYPTKSLATILDKPQDQLLYLISFMVAVICGLLLNQIQNVQFRKAFSLFMGCAVQMYMFGKGFFPCMAYVITSYLVMRFFPSKQQHYVVFVVNAVLLSIAHIHKMVYYYGFWGAEITQIMMMNLCKISAVSINYRDGTIPKEKRDTELRQREKEYLIEAVPSFYDFLGYMYYCGGTIAGPFFEYKDYINFIHRTNHYSNIPSTIMPTLKRLSHVLSFIVANVVLSDYFSTNYLLTEEFSQQGFIYKILYMVCTLKLQIFTYYVAFCFMDSAQISSGIAYNGLDEATKKPIFNRVSTVRIFDIEFSYKVKNFFDAWNISVHLWLKYYVFMRLVKKGKGLSLLPILTTFLVSAIWHGFYPGYFLFFISSGLMDYQFKIGYKIYILFEWMPHLMQKILLNVWSYIQCGYWGMCFILLDFGKIHKFHSALNYSLHLALGLSIVFIQFSGIVPYCKRLEEARLKKAN